MVLNLTIKKETWFLIVTYKNPRAPSRAYVEMLSNIYQSMFANGIAKEVILMGDLNINMMDDSNLITNELCDIYGLTNLICEPTCYKSCEGTLIDPIIVTNIHRFHKALNVRCGYSDFHNFTCCMTRLKVPTMRQKL